MKILLFSDSHGHKEAISQIINEHNDYDYVFFLGDGISDLGNLVYDKRVKFVRGNCDFFSDDKTEEVVEINNFKILLAHGHIYKVKNGLGALIARAKEGGFNLVCYGHTHQFANQNIDNIGFINPGSLKKSHRNKPSYGILNLNEKKYVFFKHNFNFFVDNPNIK